MRKLIYITAILLAFAVSSCRTQCPQQTIEYRDSIRTEYRVETVFVPDTVIVEIPLQTAERETRDSVSYLENEYATSTARINNGTLFHNLSTKPQKRPVEIQKQIEYRDSIAYRDRFIEKTVTVETEKKLSWLQQAQMKGFWILLLVLAIICRKPICELASKFFKLTIF